jgi:hypothetical membrane protein
VNGAASLSMARRLAARQAPSLTKVILMTGSRHSRAEHSSACGLVKPRRWAQQHSAHYPKLGPILYVTSIQYFAVQLFVALKWRQPYNLSRDTISDLGNTDCGTWNGHYVCSPFHNLMNASLVVLGITMTLGSVLVSRYFENGRASKAGFAAVAISGLSVIIAGFFPENSVPALHGLGAALAFVLGNASLIILALSLKIPAPLRLYFFLSGMMALLGLVAYASSHDLGLGEGGIERVVAYPQTVCLIVIGSYLAARNSARQGPAHPSVRAEQRAVTTLDGHE